MNLICTTLNEQNQTESYELKRFGPADQNQPEPGIMAAGPVRPGSSLGQSPAAQKCEPCRLRPVCGSERLLGNRAAAPPHRPGIVRAQ